MVEIGEVRRVDLLLAASSPCPPFLVLFIYPHPFSENRERGGEEARAWRRPEQKSGRAKLSTEEEEDRSAPVQTSDVKIEDSQSFSGDPLPQSKPHHRPKYRQSRPATRKTTNICLFYKFYSRFLATFPAKSGRPWLSKASKPIPPPVDRVCLPRSDPATHALLTVSADLFESASPNEVRNPARNPSKHWCTTPHSPPSARHPVQKPEPTWFTEFLIRPEPNQPGPVQFIILDLFHGLPMFQFVQNQEPHCFYVLDALVRPISLFKDHKKLNKSI